MAIEECVAQLSKMNLETTKEWIGLWKVIVPSFVTLFTVFLAYKYALSQARNKRITDLIERQITEFYSPIWGCVRKIRAQGKLRAELSEASNIAWKKICDNAPKPFTSHKEEFEPFKRLIDYENLQLNDEVMPLYDQIVNTFTSKYWLSEESTRQYYENYYRFVDIWHRYLNKTIPMETLMEIEHSEKAMEPFYKNIEKTLNSLKQKLKTL